MENNRIEIDIKVPNQTRYLSLIGKIGEDLAKGLDEYAGNRNTLAFYINLVLTESMINAIIHANAGDPRKMVHLSLCIDNDELVIRVFDEGRGFDINEVPPPDFEGLSEGGRGVFLIRAIMDSVCYRTLESGNVLEMRKSLVKHGTRE
jgi:serine/threonine-protein kinase RsbW